MKPAEHPTDPEPDKMQAATSEQFAVPFAVEYDMGGDDYLMETDGCDSWYCAMIGVAMDNTNLTDYFQYLGSTLWMWTVPCATTLEDQRVEDHVRRFYSSTPEEIENVLDQWSDWRFGRRHTTTTT